MLVASQFVRKNSLEQKALNTLAGILAKGNGINNKKRLTETLAKRFITKLSSLNSQISSCLSIPHHTKIRSKYVRWREEKSNGEVMRGR